MEVKVKRNAQVAIFVTVAISSGFMFINPLQAGSICRDGTYTKSEGRGTCSGRGGVAESGVSDPDSIKPVGPGTVTSPAENTTKAPLGAAGVGNIGDSLSAFNGKKKPVLVILNTLNVAGEDISGYNRKDFKHWITTNKCDTRQWVFIRQTLQGKQSGCSVVNGKWYSAYDGVETINPSAFDLDHMVPLSEAFRSGAYAWSAIQRMDYANDLGYRPALIAVTAGSNRSKGDKDPAKWMPPLKSDWCVYLKNWVGVKYRWDLAVDPQEKAFITQNVPLLCGKKNKMSVPALVGIIN